MTTPRSPAAGGDPRSPRTGLPPGYLAVVPLDQCFDAAYGLQIVDDDADGGTQARVPVASRTMGPTGIVHGGVYAAIAEALSARGTIRALDGDGRAVFAMSNDTRFLRPIAKGHIHSTAVVRTRAEDVWLWDVDHRDDAGRLCALTRMMIAVRGSHAVSTSGSTAGASRAAEIPGDPSRRPVILLHEGLGRGLARPPNPGSMTPSVAASSRSQASVTEPPTRPPGLAGPASFMRRRSRYRRM